MTSTLDGQARLLAVLDNLQVLLACFKNRQRGKGPSGQAQSHTHRVAQEGAGLEVTRQGVGHNNACGHRWHAFKQEQPESIQPGSTSERGGRESIILVITCNVDDTDTYMHVVCCS
jgi:hypothetical protein